MAKGEREPLLATAHAAPAKPFAARTGINDEAMLSPMGGDDHANGNGMEDGPIKNQLGTINGVYVPCLLNILGAVLFMRIGYSVGYAGWFGTVLIFIFSEIVTICTALSFSAIVTNGKMAGGGAYYMISRSIGPAFGGATGVLFYFCYVINCAFNATAFVEDIVTTFFPGAPTAMTYYWYHGTMVVLLAVALNGAGAFAKVNTMLFVTLITAILITFGSLILGHARHIEDLPATGPGSCNSVDSDLHGNLTVNYHPPRSSTFNDNFWWDWTDNNSLQVVLALIFTSTCGVMEGANLSGDLKDASHSLPKGTLLAKCTSGSTYILFTSFLALCYDRQSLRCEYLILQKTAVSPYVVVVGIAMATLSTSLGALFGAARILQAMARDHIFPLSFFKMGAKKGDEPIYAVVLTFALAQIFVYVSGPSINVIGGILTDFFLTAYAFVNLSQILLTATTAPNYRPTFKYCPLSVSVVGFVLSYVLMWYLQPVYAAITCGMWAILFIYIKLTVGERLWGDIAQAMCFPSVVSGLRQLVPRKDSPKFWRSSLLLLLRETDGAVLRLAKLLSTNGSYIIGTPLLDPREAAPADAPRQSRRRRWGADVDNSTQRMLPQHQSRLMEHKAAWLWLVEQWKLGAFVSVGCGSDLRQIYTTLISASGLGGLVPNTVLLPYHNPAAPADEVDVVQQINTQLADSGTFVSTVTDSGLGLQSASQYVRLLQNVLDCEKNLMIVRRSGGLDRLLGATVDAPATIDVWVVGGWEAGTVEANVYILLQHAYLIKKAVGRAVTVRVLQLENFTFSAEQAALEKALDEMVWASRVYPQPEMAVLPAPDGLNLASRATGSMSVEHFEQINGAMQRVSRHSALAIVALPTVPDDSTEAAAASYLANLDALSGGMPPVVFMAKGEPGKIVSTHI